jgi:hypothetical protein
MMQIPEIACTRNTLHVQNIKAASEAVLHSPLEVQ